MSRSARSASRPPRTLGGHVRGIATGSVVRLPGGFDTDCSFVAVRLNQLQVETAIKVARKWGLLLRRGPAQPASGKLCGLAGLGLNL